MICIGIDSLSRFPTLVYSWLSVCKTLYVHFVYKTFKVHFAYHTVYVPFVYNTSTYRLFTIPVRTICLQYQYIPFVVTPLIHVHNKHINTNLISIISYSHVCLCSSLDIYLLVLTGNLHVNSIFKCNCNINIILSK